MLKPLPYSECIANIFIALLFTGNVAIADDEFGQCLHRLEKQASAKGIKQANFELYTAELQPDMSVLDLLDQQPEFKTPIWDYMASLVDEERVSGGQEQLKKWHKELDQILHRYGVPAEVVVAVWGVESNFGQNFGKRPLLTSLSTLSCYGRRQSYFTGEFLNTLQILQHNDIPVEKLVGSWAGAFGHTQFMPSTFLRIAVDFDGDGKRNLIDSVPDALASTANFLRKSGWQPGQPWGYEVKLPSAFNPALAGRRNKRAISEWHSQGISRIDGTTLENERSAAGVLIPAGINGPAFLVYRNFDAIYSYNAAESYALAIAHLSDRLRGGSPFKAAWPTDDPGLSRVQRRELQNLLAARHYDIGNIDGVFGSKTIDAIKQEQKRLGHAVNGRGGLKLLEELKRELSKK